MEQPELERQPLRTIDLTREQSDALNLEADGGYVAKFVMMSRETHPGDPQCWRLWIIQHT